MAVPVAQKAVSILRALPPVAIFSRSSRNKTLLFAVENPATGKTITTIQAGDTESTNAAVEASQAAYVKWKVRTQHERCVFLMRASDQIKKGARELAVLLCLETGKPFTDAEDEITVMMQIFEYFGSIRDELQMELFDQDGIYSAVIYEPLGVCAGIIPYNSPPIHVGAKVAPCLAAGNTIILKPSQQAPLTAILIVESLQKVLPKDVIQTVPGLGPEVPQALINHPLVKMVSFTGSSTVGAQVASSAGATLTTTALQLGGKTAFIVFADADLDTAVHDAFEGAFFNKGEACTASMLILVHKSLYPVFVEKMAAGVSKLKAGDGLDPSTQIGAVISREKRQQALKAIELAKSQGARLAAQGSMSNYAHADGFFVLPTLLADVTPEMMAIAAVEICAPIACVGSFGTEDEAVEIVNASRYGLCAGIYSTDMSRAMRIARRIDVGVVLVNNYSRGVLGTPLGGTKDSGHGRELWSGSLREWSSIKDIRYPNRSGPMPRWKVTADIFDISLESAKSDSL